MAQASLRSQEYWRPADPKVARLVEPVFTEVSCWNCGIEYSPAARFCHICGSRREPAPHTTALPLQSTASDRKTAARPLLSRLPVPLASLVCFLLGIGCVLGAGLLGFIYRSDTLVDWQAVQIWRVEWLLASLAALLAGLLLKKAA